MFRIECFCEDKKLPTVLLALQGLILDRPEVTPVVNANVANGKIIQETGGTQPEMVLAYFKRNKVKQFSAADIKAVLRSIGAKENNSNHCAKVLYRRGLIRKTG